MAVAEDDVGFCYGGGDNSGRWGGSVSVHGAGVAKGMTYLPLALLSLLMTSSENAASWPTSRQLAALVITTAQVT